LIAFLPDTRRHTVTVIVCLNIEIPALLLCDPFVSFRKLMLRLENMKLLCTLQYQDDVLFAIAMFPSKWFMLKLKLGLENTL
jgi:hypothetical protein